MGPEVSSGGQVLHHGLSTELVGQEEGAVGGEGADHGGRQARVQRCHSWGEAHNSEDLHVE